MGVGYAALVVLLEGETGVGGRQPNSVEDIGPSTTLSERLFKHVRRHELIGKRQIHRSYNQSGDPIDSL